MALSDATRQRIDDLLSQHRVVLFMKGTREAPRCGFSATATGILNDLIDSYVVVDVLATRVHPVAGLDVGQGQRAAHLGFLRLGHGLTQITAKHGGRIVHGLVEPKLIKRIA